MLDRSPREGIVRVRPGGSRGGATKQLTVPAWMGRQIPDDAVFRAEWHPDGILYRYLPDGGPKYDEQAPDWTKT